MSPELSFSGLSVLLARVAPHSVATVHALLRDGARVTVAAALDDLPTSLRDLAERGLVTLDPDADPTTHDVVIRGDVSTTPMPLPTDRAVAQENRAVGTVTLLGGGLGDPGLLTVAGIEAIRAADVIVHDRLAPLSALRHARDDVQVIDVGKIPRGDFTPQERINELLVEHALAGRDVLRLKGGDNFVFGRGGEEAEACAAHGIPVVVIPGISSSIAAPALAGIPVTHRTLVQGFTVVSGHVPPGDPRSTLDWGAIARSRTTVVVLMGVATLGAIAETLVAEGLAGTTPAAVVADAGLPSMRTARATLADIDVVARREGLGAPAVVVIGDVAALDVLR
ncbi:uroporphyrinogen-III C-methyltransferase [Terrabacter carboxydivorans]|uniref:uroporphyrinogen-III C-methyltransferase n=1 Tax=Terrabacter carboxydivorans TaxID=619730 RepID=A0ABN3LK79_9MICO